MICSTALLNLNNHRSSFQSSGPSDEVAPPTSVAAILDHGCHGYSNKNVDCTDSCKPTTLVAMVTITKVMVCLNLGIKTV